MSNDKDAAVTQDATRFVKSILLLRDMSMEIEKDMEAVKHEVDAEIYGFQEDERRFVDTLMERLLCGSSDSSFMKTLKGSKQRQDGFIKYLREGLGLVDYVEEDGEVRKASTPTRKVPSTAKMWNRMVKDRGEYALMKQEEAGVNVDERRLESCIMQHMAEEDNMTREDAKSYCLERLEADSGGEREREMDTEKSRRVESAEAIMKRLLKKKGVNL